MTEEWKYHAYNMQFTLLGYRPGLRGVWDHLKLVLLKRPPPMVERAHSMYICFWAKYVTGIQLTGISVVDGSPIEQKEEFKAPHRYVEAPHTLQ